MKSLGIALICGLTLFLGNSAYAEASSRVVFAQNSFIHGGQLNFISPGGRELGQIKKFPNAIALSASNNGRYVAVLPGGEPDESEDEVNQGSYYSAFVYKAGEHKPRRVGIGSGSSGFGAAPAAVPSLEISPDGHLLAFSAGSGIRIINLDTGRRRTLRKPRGFNFHASFSGDGRHLIFANGTCSRECGRDSDIFMTGINGGSVHRLTHSPDEGEFFPEISPDGGHLAFMRRARQGLGFELVVKRIGSNRERVIRHVKCLSSRPDFSPSGKRIVYARNEGAGCGFRRATIFTVGIDGRGAHAVTRGIRGGRLPQWTRVPSR
jgi:hypothetical protein